jgi:hypothetical protein
MKLVAEYLENAHRFERMAAAETKPETKKQFQDQADAYYKLATKRAKALNMPIPPRRPAEPPYSN